MKRFLSFSTARVTNSAGLSARRRMASAVAQFGWDSKLVAVDGTTMPKYAALGRAVVESATSFDSGPEAFEEVLVARQQLEEIIRGVGYDLDVFSFGGLSVLRLLEVDGDVDFVGVSHVEPTREESSDIVARLSREMRRLGLKASAVPSARVPVLKVDRVSRAVPGSELHSMSRSAIFQATRTMSPIEQESFEKRLKNEFYANKVEWNAGMEFASVEFPATNNLIAAITHINSHGTVDIPLRLPLEPRRGPELYRYQFDFVLNSTGLRNSHLLGEYLALHPFARHMLLVLKRWAREAGVVDTIGGLLSSYAITVMLVHYLAKVDLLPIVELHGIAAEPNLLPQEPQYCKLASAAGTSQEDLASVGRAFAGFFEYYGGAGFDYETDVVCTTQALLKKKTLKWENVGEVSNRPPFFHFAIKDPYGEENIARNLNIQAARYVRDTAALAVETINSEFEDPSYLLHNLMRHPRKPYLGDKEINLALASDTSKEFEARHLLKKAEFHRRKTEMQRFGQSSVRRRENSKAAQDMTKNVLSWMRQGKSEKGSGEPSETHVRRGTFNRSKRRQ